MPITKVSATQFQNEFGRWHKEAQRGPVAVTDHGRVSSYLISAHAFEEFRAAQQRERRVYRASEIPDDLMEHIRSTRMDPKYDYLNAELDEDDGNKE